MRLRQSDVVEILKLVRPHTMVCDAGVAFTAQSVVRAISNNVAGDLVECGTWRGGCGIAMLLAQRRAFGQVQRKVHFMDSFAGLPQAERSDGRRALRWQSETADNCVASRWELERVLSDVFHFKSTEYAIWEGWFSDTLPMMLRSTDQDVALLRLDGDWFRSTLECLVAMMPRVGVGATVIVDDYYAWDGCARAVHQWLHDNDAPYRIKSLPKHSGAYFVKEKIE